MYCIGNTCLSETAPSRLQFQSQDHVRKCLDFSSADIGQPPGLPRFTLITLPTQTFTCIVTASIFSSFPTAPLEVAQNLYGYRVQTPVCKAGNNTGTVTVLQYRPMGFSPSAFREKSQEAKPLIKKLSRPAKTTSVVVVHHQ